MNPCKRPTKVLPEADLELVKRGRPCVGQEIEYKKEI